MGITDTRFVANKKFAMGGVEFLPGEPVNTAGLPEHKVGQLLNQRFLRPTPDETPQQHPNPD